jgi:D-arabinose 1-dehydrogenase-like Zn-dependent alcohol dehydrogenase
VVARREARHIRTDGVDDPRVILTVQTVESSDPAQIEREVRAGFPDGAAAILDFVSNGDTLKDFAALLAPGGTLVTTLHIADEAWFAARGLRAINFDMADTPECSPAGLDELTALVHARKLKIAIHDEIPLDEARRVLDESEQHALHGKYVLRPTALR